MAGCLNIYAKRLDKAPEVKCRRLDNTLSVLCFGLNGISADVARIGRPINVTASGFHGLLAAVIRIGKPLKVRCSFVCSTGYDPYLEVSNDTIWLIPENGFSEDVQVYSNVKWTIE